MGPVMLIKCLSQSLRHKFVWDRDSGMTTKSTHNRERSFGSCKFSLQKHQEIMEMPVFACNIHQTHFPSSSSSPPNPKNFTHPSFPNRTLQSKLSFASSNLPRLSLISANSMKNNLSAPSAASLDAILFDIDGTLCHSDPLHFQVYQVMLQEVGFNGGIPITEEFFVRKISGGHNDYLCGVLFPDWDTERARKFMEDKEALFRRLAAEQLQPIKGLHKLCRWIEDQGLKRAAVTNASRPSAELIISMLGLSEYFEIVVIGDECERAKPFPDPYLKALQALDVWNKHALIFEDSVSGTKAGVAAGVKVIALGTSHPEELLAQAGASIVIKDFEDTKLWAELESMAASGSVRVYT